MTSHSNLPSTENIEVTPCSINFGEGVTFNEWQEKGEQIATFAELAVRSLRWWVGDLVIAGENYFPDKYSQVLTATMYKEGTLRNAVYTCRNVCVDNRFEQLSFEHHYQVAKIKNEDTQNKWLRKAIKNNWSVNQLRCAINGKTPSIRAVPVKIEPTQKSEKVECEHLDPVDERMTFEEWWDEYPKKNLSPWIRDNERKIAKDAWDEAKNTA